MPIRSPDRESQPDIEPDGGGGADRPMPHPVASTASHGSVAGASVAGVGGAGAGGGTGIAGSAANAAATNLGASAAGSSVAGVAAIGGTAVAPPRTGGRETFAAD